MFDSHNNLSGATPCIERVVRIYCPGEKNGIRSRAARYIYKSYTHMIVDSTNGGHDSIFMMRWDSYKVLKLN